MSYINLFNMSLKERLDRHFYNLRKLQQDIEFYKQMKNIIKKVRELKL